MRSTVSAHSERQSAGSLQRRGLLMTALLWVVQGGLALLFLFAGGGKLILPLALLGPTLPLPLPGLFVRFIGLLEVAGALGLTLPGLFRIRPLLTPLAACGLLLEMIGATAVTLVAGKGVMALFPLVVGLVCATVAYGRRLWIRDMGGGVVGQGG